MVLVVHVNVCVRVRWLNTWTLWLLATGHSRPVPLPPLPSSSQGGGPLGGQHHRHSAIDASWESRQRNLQLVLQMQQAIRNPALRASGARWRLNTEARLLLVPHLPRGLLSLRAGRGIAVACEFPVKAIELGVPSPKVTAAAAVEVGP